MNWALIADGSHVVRACRAAARESRVVAALGPFARRCWFLRRDIEEFGTHDDGERVVDIVDGSAIVHAVATAAVRAEDAARTSGTAAVVSSVAASVAAQPLARRVRLVGLTLLTAVVVHVATTRFDAPEPTTIARLVWIVVSLLLVAVMAGADAVAAAWVDRTARRRTPNESERW